MIFLSSFFFLFFGRIISWSPFLGCLPKHFFTAWAVKHCTKYVVHIRKLSFNIKKRTDMLYLWHLQHKAHWTCYVKHDRLAVMLNALWKITYLSVLKLTLKWDYSIPFRNKWHDSIGATSSQVQLDWVSRVSSLCDWTCQLVWAPNGYTILEGLTRYLGLCNKQDPLP